jgi:beta-galactosidase
VKQSGVLITVRPGEVRHSLPASLQQSVSMWRQSPVMAERPKVIPDLADNDMNSWDAVIAGERPSAVSGSGFVILATKVSLAGDMAKSGATLRFAGITGAGEVLVNGAPAGRKPTAAPSPIEVAIPGGQTEVDVAVVLAANAGDAVGLSGPVFLETGRR